MVSPRLGFLLTHSLSLTLVCHHHHHHHDVCHVRTLLLLEGGTTRNTKGPASPRRNLSTPPPGLEGSPLVCGGGGPFGKEKNKINCGVVKKVRLVHIGSALLPKQISRLENLASERLPFEKPARFFHV